MKQSCFFFSGKAGDMIDRGDNTYGGKYVVNPSGGLISKGHPLGATGKTKFSTLLLWVFTVITLLHICAEVMWSLSCNAMLRHSYYC